MAFSPDGTKVATASGDPFGRGDGSARVFDPATGTQISRLDHDSRRERRGLQPRRHQGRHRQQRPQRAGIRPGPGTEVSRLDHDSRVNAVAFSPDGTKVATASSDPSARVFDPATGTEVSRLDHDSRVNAVTFSPDGTKVATGSDDGTARVWYANHDQLVEQAMGRLTRNLTRQEWRRYRDEPYRKTRADLP